MTYNFTEEYDIIVIGAGHAGVEASLAASRMGCKVLLATINIEMLAFMPCNPSIGGSAKGIVVREVDALGGEMAKTIDKNIVFFRKIISHFLTFQKFLVNKELTSPPLELEP